MLDPRIAIKNAYSETNQRPLADDEWDKKFSEMEMDSLDMTAFFLEIERSCNIKISDQSMHEEDTPNKVLRYLTDLRSRPGE